MLLACLSGGQFVSSRLTFIIQTIELTGTSMRKRIKQELVYRYIDVYNIYI